jgi:hypothetical protein
MPTNKVIQQEDALGIGYGPGFAGIKVDSTDNVLQFNPDGTMRTVVDLSSTQTITGDKTFTGTVVMSGAVTVGEFANGTASLPSITFSSDPNTGIYRIDPDRLGITAAGAITLEVNGDGILVDGYTLNTGTANPAAAYNAMYTIQTAANTYTGSVVGHRCTLTMSATAAIGNAYAGRFELIQSGLPASQGHTCALMAQTTVTGATNNPTSVITATLSGATGGSTTPFILFQDASTDKSTILFSVGSAGNLVGTNSGDIYYNETLRILANATARYIPLSTAEGSFTTAYPIITTKTNAAAAYDQLKLTGSESGTWTGSITGIRCTMTSSATAGIGNMYAGRFELAQSAEPSSQGHTTALYVQTTCTGATNNPTSVASFVLAGASGGNTTPFLNFIDASTDKTLYFFEAGTGGALAESTDATACFDTGININNINEITHGLRVKVNGADYYLLMGVAATVAA